MVDSALSTTITSVSLAFTVFNPRTFENIWRKWQPKDNLVFSELPPEAQNALLAELAKRVQFARVRDLVNLNHVFIVLQVHSRKQVAAGIGRTEGAHNQIIGPGRILMSVNDYDK